MMRKRLSGRPDKALVEDDAFYNSIIQIKKKQSMCKKITERRAEDVVGREIQTRKQRNFVLLHKNNPI